VHFVRAGQGAPALVFVHGFSCELADWSFQVDALQDAHEVVACDLRGHGRTPGRPAECSIENFAGDVAALVSFLDLQKAILIGHSMGCKVVLEAARILSASEHAARLAGLVLVDGNRNAPRGDPEATERASRAAIEKSGFAAFSDELFRQMFFAPSPLAERLLARTAKRPPDVGAALYPRMARFDARDLDAALAAVRVPVLAIQSTMRDRVTSKRVPLREGQASPWFELLAEHVRDVETAVIPGGHFTMLESPERVSALIRRFAAACR